MQRDVYIVDGVRTAIGKLGGTLIKETPDKLLQNVFQTLEKRTNLDLTVVDEIIIGQAKQTADFSNVARYGALAASWPIDIPAYTVHRQCGSGLQSINNAHLQINAGISECIVAGGVESMSTAPFYLNDARFGVGSGNVSLKDPNVASQPGSQPPSLYKINTMGETAENLAIKYQISREEQDEFAYNSQFKAQQAMEKGYFKDQISTYNIVTRKVTTAFEVDEHPRLTPVDKLANLKPAFIEGGTVTAGNSSGRNDGVSALLVTSKEFAEQQGLQPKVRIVTHAAAGCRPDLMGLGPVYATEKALKQVNLTIQDIDIVELNEAFAAQSIACIREMGLNIDKVNPNGGAIALGHPIGATGAILMTKLIHELERTGKKYGMVTMCIAGGLGITTIVENLRV